MKSTFAHAYSANKFLKPVTLFLVLIIAMIGELKAQNRFSIANGNWNDPTVWSTTSGGAGPASPPVAGDAVLIEGDNIITVNIATAACTSLQLGSPTGGGGSGALVFNASTQLTVSGFVSLGNIASIDRFGNLSMTAGGTLICQSLTSNSTTDVFNEGGGTIGLTATNTLPVNDVGNQFGAFNNLIINGGTTTLGKSISIANTLDVNAGTFAMGANNVSLVGGINMNGTSITGSGTLTLTGIVTVAAGPTQSIISAPINLGAANRTFNVNDGVAIPDLLVSGIISGTGGLVKTGTGSMNLSVLNTYTGPTSAAAGTLRVALIGGSIPNASALTVTSTLDLNGFNETVGSISGGGTITSAAAGTLTLTTGGDNTSTTYSGLIQNGSATSVALVKNGSGVLTLSSSNTNTGGTTLNAGGLNINNSNSLGSATSNFTINGGAINNTTGGSLTTVNYPQSWNGDFTFTGTQNLNLGTGAVTMNANRLVTVAANTLTVGGVISAGTINLTKSGAGNLSFGSNTVTLNTVNVNSGTLISTSGTLNLTGDLTAAGSFTNNSGTVNFNGSSTQSIAGVTYNNLTLSGAGQKNASGSVAAVNLNNASVFDIGANTLSVSGSTTNTGTIRFSGPSNGLAISTGTIEYYGTSQNITAGTYNNLTINQSGGEAILIGDVVVTGTLTLASRNLNLNGFNLSLGPTATAITGAPFSSTKMLIATGGSEVRKMFTAPGSFSFPIGDNTGSLEYSPIIVNVNTGIFGSPYVGVSVVDAKHPNNASSTHFLSRYWNITNSGITNATITATYLPVDIGGTEGSISAAQLSGTFNQTTNGWTKYSGLVSNTLTATNAPITSGQLSSFTGITGANPSVSIIGGGISICIGSSVPLTASVSGGDPSIIYSWVPAAGLSATTVSNPTAAPIVTTAYSVSIRDGNGILATSAPSTITVDQNPSASNAGSDQNFCGTSVTLSGNNPGVGTGSWSLAPSNTGTGGSFGNALLFNSGFNGAAGQTYILRWSISNGICTTSTDDVQIRFDASPSVSAAGSDQSGASAICGTSTSLGANTPVIGTGSWSVVIGAGGSFVSSSSAVSGFNGIAGTTYTLRWTISNGVCTSSTDDVVVSLLQSPSASNAGSDQSFCGTSVTLSGNAPSVGTGSWSLSPSNTGTGGSFGNASLFNSSFNGTAGQTYTLRWSISNGICTTSTDDVQIRFDVSPSVSVAGSDQSGASAICGTSTSLGANTPVIGTGSWSVVIGAGGSFVSSSSAVSGFNGIAGTTYTLRWTISNGVCTSSTDDVVIRLDQTPTASFAGSDITQCNNSTFNLAGNNPSIGVGVWSYVSGFAGITITTPGSNVSSVTGLPAGNIVTLRWTINSGICSSVDDVILNNNVDPFLATPLNQILCAGGTTTAVTFSGNASQYSWTNDQPSIGLPASGVGNIGAFTALNSGGTPVVATILITPTSGFCIGTQQSFTYTVNPKPVIDPISNIATGTGVVVGPIALTTNTLGGETFSWSGGSSVGLTDGTGSSSIPSFTTTNSGVTTISAIVSVTAVKNGCPGPALNFTITVYPVPGALAGDQNICTGDYSSVFITGTVVGTTFAWTVGTVTGTVSGQTSGSGSIIAQQLTSVAGGVVEYIITPTANGVAGPTTSVFVGVLPAPVGNFVPAGTYRYCSGDLLNITPTSSVSGSTYTWTGSNSSGGSGNITDSPTNSTNSPIDITYTVIPTGPTPTFCVGAPFTIVVTVNPNPSFTANNSTSTICSGSNTSILFNSTTTGHQINVVSVNYNGAGNSGTIIPGTTTFTNGNTLIESLTNSTNAPIDVVYTFNVTTPSSTPACPVTPVNQIVMLRVYPVPNAFASSQSICSGSTSNVVITNPNAVSGTTFTWTLGTVIGTVSGQSAGSGTTISQTLTSALGGSVQYIITPIANGCTGIPLSPITISVDPMPVGNNVAVGIYKICSGTSLNITPTLSVGSGTFAWSGSNGSGGNGNITDAPTNSTNNPINITYTVIPKGLSTTFCLGAPFTIVVTINPNPSFTATNNTPTICSGLNTNILFNSATTGHQINVVSVNYNGAGNSGTIIPGTTTFTNGNTLVEALANSTNAPIDVVYTFNVTTPSATPACPLVLVNQVVTVKVYPVPNASAVTPQTICSGSATNIVISNPNAVAGTTFTWTVVGPSNVTGASAGSGALINQFLTSTNGTSVGTLTYRITPAANGCNGTPFNLLVNVTPKPTITNPATDFIQDICSGATLNFTPTSTVSGTTYNWTSTVIGTLGGVSASGTGAINDTPINATNINAAIIYTVTPSVSGCSGNPVNVVITVHPVPNAFASNQIICSGSSTSIVVSNPNNVTGTTYTWTVSPTNANGATPGTGNTITQVLTSANGTSNGTVDYTITPYANGCAGAPITATVTIKPVPVLTNSPASFSQQVCSGQPIGFMPLANIGGASTIFSWSSVITGTINPASVTSSGSGLINDTPINTGNSQGTIRYTIIPTLNSCSGLPIDLIVTIKPLPSASGIDALICSGQNAIINILPAPVNVSGTTFSWTAAPSSNVVGAANGNGSTISQILSTTNAMLGTVAYSVTPSANGCNGPITILKANINPIASVNAGADTTVCETLTFPGVPMGISISGTIGGSATSGTWSIVSGFGSGSISSSVVSGNTVTATYTVGAGDIASQVRLRLTTNDPDTGGPCSFVSDDLLIKVNKRARVTLPANYTVCESPSIDLTGTLGGSAINGLWNLVSPNLGTLTSSSLTGSTMKATYFTDLPNDVNANLIFRLTAYDPDGFGPCTDESAQITIHVDESAKVNAGLNFEVCEDQIVNLNGSYSGSTLAVNWTGASGSTRFGNVNNPTTTYTLTPIDIAGGGITLTLSTNNPSGPCSAVSDQVFVKIYKLPTVFLFGLEVAYAENAPVDFLDGVPTGGSFTGPGIVAGTNQFNPANAGVGPVTITYTYTDPVTGCDNFTTRPTIVNPVTSIDFYVFEENRPDANGFPQICANQGDPLTLIGVPAPGNPATSMSASFVSLSPVLTPFLINVANDWYIETDGLPTGTYQLQYVFKNTFGATTTVTKNLIVFAGPTAVITSGDACITGAVPFTQNSVINDNPDADNITQWIWSYGDGESESGATASHVYETAGVKLITLEVMTNNLCRNKETKSINIGVSPVPNFLSASFCKGNVTTFEDTSESEVGTINSYLWDFDDSGATSTEQNPSHTYSGFGSFNVKLTIGTDAGCSADTTKTVFILDSPPPITGGGYETDFESGQGSWIDAIDYNDGGDKTSWKFGTPDGEQINGAASLANAWWTGANNKSFYSNEKSFVIGPCLNIQILKRPMISLNYWSDTQKGFDGAVLQYSDDEGMSWKPIGDANGKGINWYNSRDLPGEPGGQDNFAWSDTLGGWRNARFNLEEIAVAERDLIVFRIAFGSNTDNTGRKYNGFAFDDIFIGEKKRNVLVEHFTNDFSIPSNTADSYLDNLFTNSYNFNLRDSSDFIKLQYHIANPGFDQINADNPGDPSARRIFYGVSQPPVSIMDGIIGQYYSTTFNGSYAYITDEEIDRRALEDPSFNIVIDTTSASSNVLDIKLKYTYIDLVNSLNSPVILHAALVESGEDANKNYLRKLLLQAEGKVINKTWSNGIEEVVPVNYTIDVPIRRPDNLSIIAFVQDKNSGRILQSVIRKINRKVGSVVVGVSDDPATAEISGLDIYPNPVSNTLNLQTDNKLHQDYKWKLIDQRGVIMLEGKLNRDLSSPQQVDVSKLAGGIYFMAIQSGEKSVVYRKIAVINRN